MKNQGQRVRASTLVYNEEGQCVARYDKIHLFDVNILGQESYQESKTIEPGHQLVVVDTPFGHIGLSICYDLRFPELYRTLIQKHAQIIVVPSAFTAKTGAAHWEVLIKARAIENLCYILAANQGGQHQNGRVTYGHSMVVDPWGNTLGELETGEGMLIVDLDLKKVMRLRHEFPCIAHRVL